MTIIVCEFYQCYVFLPASSKLLRRGCVTSRLVQLENEGRKTDNREEEKAKKQEQRREKNMLNSFLKLLQTVRYEPNLLLFFGEIKNIYRIKRENFSYIGYSLGISLITRKKNKETNSPTNGATT